MMDAMFKRCQESQVYRNWTVMHADARRANAMVHYEARCHINADTQGAVRCHTIYPARHADAEPSHQE